MSDLEKLEPNVQTVQQDAPQALQVIPELVEQRRQAFIDGVIEGKSCKQAALDAGYSYATARQATRAILPQSRELLREALAYHAGAGKLAKHVVDGLEAESSVFGIKDGVICDERKVPAHSARVEYAKLAAKLMDLEPASKTELSGPDGAPIQVAVVHIGMHAKSK